MHRESLSLPTRRRYSNQAGSKFREIVEAIARLHEPTPTQLENLERSYGSTGQHLMECPELRDHIVLVHGQGSRMIGTLIRPSRLRAEGYDVDGVVRLRAEAFAVYSGIGGPGQLIDDVFRPLERYALRHSLDIFRWDRCVTLTYADGMKVDITPVIADPLSSLPFGETHARVPDRDLRRFSVTNPMGLVNSFNETAKVHAVFTDQIVLDSIQEARAKAEVEQLPNAADVQNRLLSQLVQLVKVHRNVSFPVPEGDEKNFAPKSVFITALVSTAYAVRAPVPHASQLDLMLDVVQHMPTYLRREPLPGGGEYWTLANPTAPGNNLAGDMNTPAHQSAFLQWHARLVSHLEQILDCIEDRQGLDKLLPLLEDAFGSSAATAVRELEQPRSIPGAAARTILVGTAIASTVSLPARAHNFYGKK
ncbi:MAG: nucleotidyltransferase [Polaromonas sp.]|jgi:hypothetical protein|uniref:nucleotidyltransferase domain-containing protein n=1 Tax=Polaromonas sp. TaxID=1869339 RepID=UPI002487FAE5|nr:nucleotidyltransferase [Polaromonas sp.]MDI1268338.1 nucleotidyltransferase [Polaromonas sp.]